MLNLPVVHCPLSKDGYESLFPNDAKFFIGGISTIPGKAGQFIPHLTDNLSKQEFINFLTSTFGSAAITTDDLIEFRLDIEDMFKYHTDFIVTMIRDSNNALFKRMVEFSTDGTFRSFQVLYSRLSSGGSLDQATIHNMIFRLNDLYAHFLKELKIRPEFTSDGSPVTTRYSGTRMNPVYHTAENFYMLVDVLLMHMACEYFGSKEYFSTEMEIQQSLTDIRNVLTDLLKAPKHNKTHYNQYNNQVVDSSFFNIYIVNNWLKAPEKFQKIKLLTSGNYNAEYMATLLKSFAYPNDHHYTKLHVDIGLTTCQHEYFDILLNLIGRLNHVEQMYLALKQKAGSNTTESNEDVGAQFKLMFNAPVVESFPSTEVLQG